MSDFIIPIRVENEQDLYNPFDPSGQLFSDAFTAYLANYMEDRKLGEHIRLSLMAAPSFDADRFARRISI